jgi:hypothetical protein
MSNEESTCPICRDDDVDTKGTIMKAIDADEKIRKALEVIIDELLKLDDEQRSRVVLSVCVFFNVERTGR